MVPMLIIDTYTVSEWEGRNVRDIAVEVNGMEREMKKAVGYTWANHHIRIAGFNGKPALTIQFYDRNPTSENTVDFWNAQTGTSMPSFSGKVWLPEWTETIKEWCAKISRGLTRCSDCGEWFTGFKQFDFAGAVCEECYNPKIHRPPDSF